MEFEFVTFLNLILEGVIVHQKMVAYTYRTWMVELFMLGL